MREIDELQFNDASIKQVTEQARLTGLMQNIKLTSIDFEHADVKIDFITEDEPLPNDCLQKD